MKNKLVTKGDEIHTKMLKGMEQVFDAVSATMGPDGNCVIIQNEFGQKPVISKDGYTVASEIKLKDVHENMGCDLIKATSENVVKLAGDGTTTVTVLTYTAYKNGLRLLGSGCNRRLMIKGMLDAKSQMVENLKEMAKPIKGNEDIISIATISANNDSTIGNLIGKAYESVGENGSVIVKSGSSFEDTLDVIKGTRIDKGYLSDKMVINGKSNQIEYENSFLLLSDTNIDNINTIFPILQYTAKTQKPLIIVTNNISDEVLRQITLNIVQKQIPIVVVKSPGFGKQRTEALTDIAVKFNSKVVDGKEVTFDKIISDLGVVSRCTITKEETILFSDDKENHRLSERIEKIKSDIAEANSDYEKAKARERLSNIDGGIAIINVGAHSEVELLERIHRIDDALEATKSALKSGVLAGGGIALLRSSEKLVVPENCERDYLDGFNLVKNLAKEPIKIITRNAGVESGVVIEKVSNHSNPNYGFNALTKEYVDMIESKVVDPLLVEQLALDQSISTVTTALMTSVSITDILLGDFNEME